MSQDHVLGAKTEQYGDHKGRLVLHVLTDLTQTQQGLISQNRVGVLSNHRKACWSGWRGSKGGSVTIKFFMLHLPVTWHRSRPLRETTEQIDPSARAKEVVHVEFCPVFQNQERSLFYHRFRPSSKY